MLGYTPWVVFFIHVTVQFGFVPGVLFPELGFGTPPPFLRLWLQFLLVAFPLAGPETGAAEHAAPFGLKSLKSFQHAVKYTSLKLQLWAAMFQASMFCNRQSLGDSRTFRHKWKPDWSWICNYDQ